MNSFLNTSRRPSKFPLFSPEIHDLKSSFLTMDTTRRTMIGEYKTKKILIMGLSDTGKSSMTLKFLYGFPDAANPGTEESHYTSIKYYSLYSLHSNNRYFTDIKMKISNLTSSTLLES